MREYGNAIVVPEGMYSQAEIIGILRFNCETSALLNPEIKGHPATIQQGPTIPLFESYEEVPDPDWPGETMFVGRGEIIGVQEQWGWYVVVYDEGEEPLDDRGLNFGEVPHLRQEPRPYDWETD
jgi:hypothetical protein